MALVKTRSQRRARTGAYNIWEVAGDVIAVALVGLVLWDNSGVHGAPGTLALAVAVGCVVARRRLPVAAAVGATSTALVAGFVWDSVGTFTIVVFALGQLCLLSVALRRGRTAALITATALAAVLLAQSFYAQRDGSLDLRGLLYLTWTAAVLGTGLAVRAQRDYVASLVASKRAAEEDREREVTRRVVQERLRIARDLHDSVAHNISVISIHAGSAERTMQSAPAEAVASLTAIRSAIRTVLGEMQQILQVLRTEEVAETTVPGTAAVPELLATLRGSGLQVWYVQEPSVIDLPQTVDLTVYRFLQEALTNAARYSDGTARVSVAATASTLQAKVENRHGSGNRPARTNGFGLVGMRERVTSAGGDLTIVDTPEGFAAVATFPLLLTARPESP